MPTLTPTGVTALFGLAALVLAAGLTGHPVLGLAAAIAGGLLLLAYGSLALLLFELERRRLEFTWSLRERPEPRAGGEAEIELFFRNLSPRAWRPLRVEMVASPALLAEPVELELPPRRAVSAVLRVRTPRAGRWVAYGATLSFEDPAGLFRVGPYCPRHLAVRVRSAAASGPAIQRARTVSEGGSRSRRLRGFGTDLREIREHRHGDPFRRIAWKASARLGRLMVREFEAELRVPMWLAVDVGPSMRRGQLGHAGIDQAVRAATAFAEAALADGDPVGACVFGTRVRAVVPLGLGAGQLQRIEEVLLESVTDLAMEDVLDGRMGLMRAAAAYLTRESGLRVRPDLHGAGDDALTLASVARVVEKLWRTGRLAPHPTNDDERLQAFARYFAVDPPLQPEGSWGPTERGIAAALDVVAGGSRGSRLVLVVSDLGAVQDVKALARSFARRRHRVQAGIVVPWVGEAVAPDGMRAVVDARLREIARARERREVAAGLTRAGVPLLAAGPDEDLRRLLAKAASFRERIRAAG